MKKVATPIICLVVLAGILFIIKDKAIADTYKIGFIGALTGDGAAYGEPLRNVAQIAVDEINQAGGIEGKKVELIAEDGKCTGEGGAAAASKLVNVDKVKVIIGGVCSNESLAAIPIVEAAKVALLSPSSNSMDLTGRSPLFFRDYPTVTEEGRVLADLADAHGKKLVGFLQEQDAFTLGVAKAFSDEFLKADKVLKVEYENFSPGTTDFKTHILNLRAKNPDVVFINPLNPGTGSIILDQMKALGWKPQLMINDPIAGDSSTLMKNMDMLEGAWTTEFAVDLNNLKMSDLINQYKVKYGTAVPYQSFAQTTYDAVYLVRDAIQAVGYDGQKIAAWGHAIKDWQGASGSITIDTNGDRVGGPVTRIVRNGKLEPLR